MTIYLLVNKKKMKLYWLPLREPILAPSLQKIIYKFMFSFSEFRLSNQEKRLALNLIETNIEFKGILHAQKTVYATGFHLSRSKTGYMHSNFSKEQEENDVQVKTRCVIHVYKLKCL